MRKIIISVLMTLVMILLAQAFPNDASPESVKTFIDDIMQNSNLISSLGKIFSGKQGELQTTPYSKSLSEARKIRKEAELLQIELDKLRDIKTGKISGSSSAKILEDMLKKMEATRI
ncbi:TPA: hypothetical protein HA219_03505 [Candidatus Woesearchaeota archaeon]|nr:hypothetical protein [uncultured archaeon]AQS32039.1 hypothetical protein [uncultured archaeon]MBS3115232.1 hypothetical protein [Candidatus Woesearchaeota archaeon]HIH39760.1 hypothetical protein [Candidatus Woesearchaeota archaeon]